MAIIEGVDGPVVKPEAEKPTATRLPTVTDASLEPASTIPIDSDNTFGAAPYEVWFDDAGQTFLVWFTPAINPDDSDIPLAYRIPDREAFEDIFWAGATRASIRESGTTVRAVDSTAGAVIMGTTNLIPSESINEDNQFDRFVELYERQAETQPWLLDPEMLALFVGANVIEDREVTPEEFSQTEWWQTHSATERTWLELVNADPSSAQQLLGDQRLNAETALRDAGISSPREGLVNFVADKVTMGTWTVDYANRQVTKLGDPFAPGELDGELANFKVGDTTQLGEERVRELVTEWLGPTFGDWNPGQLDRWAGRIRNDDDAETELIEMLRQQRLALFPTYENRELTYENIAAPWRQVVNQIWGQIPDETDPLFAQVINLNDLGAAQQLLRTEGLKRGNQTVTSNALEALAEAFGGPVRRSDQAVL